MTDLVSRQVIEQGVRDLELVLRRGPGLAVRQPWWVKPPEGACFFEIQLGHEGSSAVRISEGGVAVPKGHRGVVRDLQVFVEYWLDTATAEANPNYDFRRNGKSAPVINPPGTIVADGHPAYVDLGVLYLAGDTSFRSGDGLTTTYCLIGYGHPFYRAPNDVDAPIAELGSEQYDYMQGEPWFLGLQDLQEGETFEMFFGDGALDNPRVVTLGLRGWIAPVRERRSAGQDLVRG